MVLDSTKPTAMELQEDWKVNMGGHNSIVDKSAMHGLHRCMHLDYQSFGMRHHSCVYIFLVYCLQCHRIYTLVCKEECISINPSKMVNMTPLVAFDQPHAVNLS